MRGGGNLIYLAEKFPGVKFEGIDYDDRVVELARSSIPNNLQNNCEIINGDWYDLDKSLKNRYSGCISFQTLSWLDGYKKAIEALAALNPEWMAFSSLFWEGNVDYFIKAVDYGNEVVNFNDCTGVYNYNVYSLPSVKDHFANLGYKEFDYIPFIIDIDLEQKNPSWFGTYTKKLENGERLQISGGIMMPWYFIFAKK